MRLEFIQSPNDRKNIKLYKEFVLFKNIFVKFNLFVVIHSPFILKSTIEMNTEGCLSAPVSPRSRTEDLKTFAKFALQILQCFSPISLYKISFQ